MQATRVSENLPRLFPFRLKIMSKSSNNEQYGKKMISLCLIVIIFVPLIYHCNNQFLDTHAYVEEVRSHLQPLVQAIAIQGTNTLPD